MKESGDNINKYIFTVCASFLFLAMLFSGCIDDPPAGTIQGEANRFVGSWQTDEGLELILSSDESCLFIGGSGDWELKDGKLFITIRFEDGQNMMSYDYQFSDKDTTLTLIDAGDRLLVFAKQ